LKYDRAREELVSIASGLAYPIREGIPIMLVDEARTIDADRAGSHHRAPGLAHLAHRRRVEGMHRRGDGLLSQQLLHRVLLGQRLSARQYAGELRHRGRCLYLLRGRPNLHRRPLSGCFVVLRFDLREWVLRERRVPSWNRQ